jgi:hypothetical protein
MDSSLGLPNGPFQVYLLAPAVAVSPEPIAPYYVVALLNTLGVLALWAFTRSFWGSRTALAAAAFCAANPMAVVTSRRLLGNDLLAPFTVLLVWSLCELARRGRRRDHVLPFVWLTIATQVYVVGLAHLAIAGVGIALAARRLRPRWLVAGILTFVGLSAPYWLGSLLPHLSSLETLAAGDATVDVTSLDFTLKLVSSEGYQVFAGQTASLFDATGGIGFAATLGAYVLLVLGLVVCVTAVVRARLETDRAAITPYVLVALTAFLPAILLIRHSAPVYILYLVGALPMPYLLVALGLGEVWRRARAATHGNSTPFRVLAAASTSLIIGTHLALGAGFLSVIREYWPSSDYGLPLRYSLESRDATAFTAQSAEANRVLIIGAGERDSVAYGLLKPRQPEASYVDASSVMVVPDATAGRVLYLVPGDQDVVSKALGSQTSGRPIAYLRFPGRDPGRDFYAVGGADLDRLAAAMSPARTASASFGDYLSLLAYGFGAASPTDGAVNVTLLWRVQSAPTEQINLYAHLVGGMGSVWGQWDGLPYSQEEWRTGDRILQTVRLTPLAGTPPGEYAVEVGAYSLLTGERLPVADPGTQPSDRLSLGVVQITRPEVLAGRPPGAQVAADFGDYARLETFALDPAVPVPGSESRVTLHWRSLSATPADFTVFVHLADANGRPVTQGDGPPAYGGYPTSRWQAGDLVRDPHALSLPRDVPPGRYWLLVGLYDSAGVRLSPRPASVSPADRLGAWLERRTPYRVGPRVDGDHVILTAVDIAPSR